MQVIGYCRVSRDTQDVKNQGLEILEYARKNEMAVNEFIVIEISSRKNLVKRRVTEVMGSLQPQLP